MMNDEQSMGAYLLDCHLKPRAKEMVAAALEIFDQHIPEFHKRGLISDRDAGQRMFAAILQMLATEANTFEIQSRM